MANEQIKTNYVKFLRGTPEAYKNLASKDADTLYFISETGGQYGTLYLGAKVIAGGSQPEIITLDMLKDIAISEGVVDNSLLVYDEAKGQWVNKPLEEVVGDINPVSQTQIFEIDLQPGQKHADAIAAAVGDKVLQSGDIAIVKELIASEKYQHTAYVYNGAAWAAMDGNYNAESVYFDEDLMTTTAVGVIELENGQATISAAGKNLKEVFNTIFVKEQNPETEDPSVSVSLPKAKAYEVGTILNSISYTVSFDDGSYSYGPEPTGAEATATEVVLYKGDVIYDSASFAAGASHSGTFNMTEALGDGDVYKITATVSHTDGNIPITNVGNEYEDGKIEAGDKVKMSGSITSFRAFFYGMDAGDGAIDSALIRGLTNGGAYNGTKTLGFTAANLEGVKRFIIAVPNSSTRGGLSSATIKSSMNADATADYVLMDETVDVEGLDGFESVPYKIWVYQPASIASTEIHSVVLS